MAIEYAAGASVGVTPCWLRIRSFWRKVGFKILQLLAQGGLRNVVAPRPPV